MSPRPDFHRGFYRALCGPGSCLTLEVHLLAVAIFFAVGRSRPQIRRREGRARSDGWHGTFAARTVAG